jgi:hypothetical protein
VSGSCGLEFSGAIFGEIGCCRAFEALLAVDGGVDFGSRKNESILSGIRRACAAFAGKYSNAFISLSFRNADASFILASRSRLRTDWRDLQHGEVLLDGPVDALLVEREELELLRFEGEHARRDESGVELGNVGAALRPP